MTGLKRSARRNHSSIITAVRPHLAMNTVHPKGLCSGLTCVGDHQSAASVTEHCSGFVQWPAGSQRALGVEDIFVSFAQRRPDSNSSVVWSQATRKRLRVGHDVVLRHFSHIYRCRDTSVCDFVVVPMRGKLQKRLSNV